MPDRAAGYVTDVGYTRGYHPELSPFAARLAFLRAGLESPRVATACELGFGQGVSLAIHAAASPIRWWGCDLLPEHVRNARALDAASGAGSVLVAATFEEFAQRTDLPPFDFIGLHGVLSWVSAANRACIAGFLQERLAPGGVVYTGYNALPGWAEMLALREVMAQHAARAGEGGTIERIEAALAFTASVLRTHPPVLQRMPGLAGSFERLRLADRRYLAHEYFNRDWHPLHVAEVAGLLGSAGLQYACPARWRDQLDELNLAADQRRVLAGIADPVLRETVRDFLVGVPVRRDFWVRERRPASAGARRDAWRALRIVQVTARTEVPERASGPLGEMRLDGPAHRVLLDGLTGHGPRPLGELAAVGGCDLEVLADAAFQLAALGHVLPVQDDSVIGEVAARCARLNAQLRTQAAAGEAAPVLASAMTGGGVPGGAHGLLH
jgi:hypothetical protein